MSAEVEIAAVQAVARPGSVRENLDRIGALVRDGGAGADLIVCPEMVGSGYDLAVVGASGPDLAEEIPGGPTVELARQLAAETGGTLVIGVLERDRDLLFDTVVVVGADGVSARYRKTHLYPPERRYFRAGDELVSVATGAGRIGLMICFEHAFPEIATALALAGSQMLAIPSAVPAGYEHLLALRTRARAQDNQIFAIAANLTGGPFFGGSLIAGPRGEVIAQAGERPEVLRARVDLDAIEREREREPALALRRPDLYGAPVSSPAAKR